MSANPFGDIVKLSDDSVTLIDTLVASGNRDADTLEALKRNADHLELVMVSQSLSATKQKAFLAAIAKARALVE